MNNVIGLYGAGSFGCEVAALLPNFSYSIREVIGSDDFEVVFIDSQIKTKELMGIRILSEKEFLEIKNKSLYFTITISNPSVKNEIADRLIEKGIKPITLIYKGNISLSDWEIGKGSIIMPNAIISNFVSIGDFVHINFGTYVGHDCRIGNFVTISPGVNCCGFVTLMDRSFIGAGATIIQGDSSSYRYIGKDSVLGIGSTLITNLPDNETYSGNPARTFGKTVKRVK